MKQTRFLILETLKAAPYFNIQALEALYGGRKESLYTNIKRWLKGGDLLRLKKGVYTTKAYVDSLYGGSVVGYKEFLANTLVSQSYLSLEYILQKYSVISESVSAHTSITLKSTKTVNNKLGKYMYFNISPKLFNGYNIVDRSGFSIAEASKSKALFDYLYFRLLSVKTVSLDLLLSFRLNLDDFTDKDFDEFKTYCSVVKQKKFRPLPKLLKEVSKI